MAIVIVAIVVVAIVITTVVRAGVATAVMASVMLGHRRIATGQGKQRRNYSGKKM